MSTFWQGLAKTAQAPPTHRFGTRSELLNEPFLNECWRDIRQEAAAGGDRLRAPAYERHLAEHIHHLVERRKRKRYRAKRGRRRYIPTGEGKLRP
jgi:RNA-directed DNA polymerase